MEGELPALVDDDVDEGGRAMVEEPRTLKKRCLQFVEEHFDSIPSLACLPGVVAQQVLEYMMKRRKGGSRTMNSANITKFLHHKGMQWIDLNSFWLTAEPFVHLDCPHLLYLDLSGALHIGDEGVTGIARGCPQLQHLNVKGNKLSDAALFELAQYCLELEVLYLQSAGEPKRPRGRKHKQAADDTQDDPPDAQITDKGVRSIANQCKRLRRLSISRAVQVTDEGVRAIAQSCTALESLSLSGCSVTLAAFTILSCMPPVPSSSSTSSSSSSSSSSTSSTCSSFPSDFVPAVCFKLQRLKLNFEEISASAPSAAVPCYLPALLSLKLYKHSTLRDLPFLHLPQEPSPDGAESPSAAAPSEPPSAQIAPGASRQQASLLSGPVPLPEASRALFHPLPSLEAVYLDSLPKLTDAAIVARLLPFSEQLRILELRRLTKVTGSTLEILLDARRHNERAQYCAATWGMSPTSSRAEPAEPTVDHTSPQLRSLAIHQCQATQSLDISLPASLQNLELSCIYWNTTPNDLFRPDLPSTQAEVSSYPHLHRIDLSMTFITDGMLQSLADLCPNVKELNLADCHRIRDRGLEYLFPSASTPAEPVQPAFVTLSSYLSPSASTSALTSLPSSSTRQDEEPARSQLLQLEALTLSKCGAIKRPTISSVHLTKLDLSWCQIADLSQIKLPFLKTLDVSGAQQFQACPGFFTFLSHSPRLRSLWAMWPCALDNTEALDHLTCSGSSSARRTLLPQLRVLNVVCMRALEPRHVEAVIANCPKLRTLHLGACPRLNKSLVDEWELQYPRILFKGWERVRKFTPPPNEPPPDKDAAP